MDHCERLYCASLFHKQQSRQTYTNNASRRFPIFEHAQFLVVSRSFYLVIASRGLVVTPESEVQE